MSHIMSNGLLFGSMKVSDAGFILIFFDCMAFTVLVQYWDAAGRLSLRRNRSKPPTARD